MQLNNFQSVPQPRIESPPIPEDSQVSAHPRKSAFAAMKDLQERFHIAGIDTEQVWGFLKSEYSVDSRSQFTPPQWAMIAAQLQSARRDDEMFNVFVDGIPNQYFRIHVYADDSSVPIGRPRDIRKHHLASEWGDFQQLANDNQCGITVTQGKHTTYYEPNPEQTERTDKNSEILNPTISEPEKPVSPEPTPVISLDTNAHGEVLSPWGTVVEVRHA